MRRWMWLACWCAVSVCFAQDAPEPKPADPPAAEKPAEPEKPAAEKPAEEKPGEEPAEKPAEKPAPTEGKEAPWIKVTPKLGGAGKPIRSPKDELAVFGVGDSDWQRAADGRAWGTDDEELLFKILNRFPRFGRASIEAWRKSGVTWDTVLEKSAEYRGEVLPVRGRVKSIEKIPLIPELVDRFEMDFYYRLKIVSPDTSADLQLFVRELPLAWQNVQGECDFLTAIDAIYLKRAGGEDNDSQPTIYLAGNRPGWYPDQPDAAAGIAPVHVLLAKYGFDVGLLGDLKGTDRLPFARFDQEPFYQTLHALAVMKPAEFKAIQFEPLDLAELFSKSDAERLHGVSVKGVVRRLIKVRITEEELLQRFGQDHYYQMDVFLPLDRPVVLGKDTKDGKALRYDNDFPATLCVLQLPPGLKEGENLHEMITADALFYRLWSYGSEFVSERNPRVQQQSPMFMATTVTVVPESKLTLSYVDIAAGFGVLAVLAAFGGGLYFFGRMTNRQAAEERGQHLPEKIELP